MAIMSKEDLNNIYPSLNTMIYKRTGDDKDFKIEYIGIINLMDNLIRDISDTKDIEIKDILIKNFIKVYKVYNQYKGGGSNE